MHRFHSRRAGDDHYAQEAGSPGQSALDTARHSARRMNERLAHGFDEAHAHAGPAIDRWASRASQLAHRGGDALREGSWQLRDRTLNASRTGMQMARDEPVKAVLLAVGIFAAAAVVYGLIRRSR